jgi:hypothetical protein
MDSCSSSLCADFKTLDQEDFESTGHPIIFKLTLPGQPAGLMSNCPDPARFNKRPTTTVPGVISSPVTTVPAPVNMLTVEHQMISGI